METQLSRTAGISGKRRTIRPTNNWLVTQVVPTHSSIDFTSTADVIAFKIITPSNHQPTNHQTTILWIPGHIPYQGRSYRFIVIQSDSAKTVVVIDWHILGNDYY